MDRTVTAFADRTPIATGPVEAVLRAAWPHRERELLFYDDDTGAPVDFDLRGSVDDVVAREAPVASTGKVGRPKLGVVSREVSLLPAQWAWLETQPNGISAALRRLVEDARHAEPAHLRERRRQAATGRMLTAVAGDLPGYEEATRALYANDVERFAAQVQAWPAPLRDFFVARVKPPR